MMARLRRETQERIEFYLDAIPHDLGLSYHVELWDHCADEVMVNVWPRNGWDDTTIDAATVLFDLWEVPAVIPGEFGPTLRWTPEEATVLVLHDPAPFLEMVGSRVELRFPPRGEAA